jgi:hypothetical protein
LKSGIPSAHSTTASPSTTKCLEQLAATARQCRRPIAERGLV